ncbi:MAG: hypothetical protein BWY11_02135 [Firmicutes bacterium ADurb.Bin182]|nr:MAG: hypothetical protein BWY11_02135 [Firmicutes bacterium ADurb.Bin182]
MSFAGYIMSWSTESAVCLLIGLILFVVEFIVPGFSGFGIAGAAFLIAAVVIHAVSPLYAVISCVLILLLLFLSAMIVFRSLKRGKLSRLPLILNEKLDADSASLSGMGAKDMKGREGVSVNLLRPSGNAEFDGVRLDVIASGEFIEKGKRIRIERIEGSRIFVREVPEENRKVQ